MVHFSVRHIIVHGCSAPGCKQQLEQLTISECFEQVLCGQVQERDLTVYVCALSSNVESRLLVADDGDELAPDKLRGLGRTHVGVVHGVDHRAIKVVRPFVRWECEYVWHTAEFAGAQDHKVRDVRLEIDSCERDIRGKNQLVTNVQ